MPKIMTIPVSLDLNTGIISPKPTTRTQSFTAMSNFAPITDLSFLVGPHHLSHTINQDLNKVYLEQFKDSQFNNLITDRNHTAIKPNVIALLWNKTESVIDLLINPLPTYAYVLIPKL